MPVKSIDGSTLSSCAATCTNFRLTSEDSCDAFYVDAGVCKAGILPNAKNYSKPSGSSSSLVATNILIQSWNCFCHTLQLYQCLFSTWTYSYRDEILVQKRLLLAEIRSQRIERVVGDPKPMEEAVAVTVEKLYMCIGWLQARYC